MISLQTIWKKFHCWIYCKTNLNQDYLFQIKGTIIPLSFRKVLATAAAAVYIGHFAKVKCAYVMIDVPRSFSELINIMHLYLRTTIYVQKNTLFFCSNKLLVLERSEGKLVLSMREDRKKMLGVSRRQISFAQADRKTISGTSGLGNRTWKLFRAGKKWSCLLMYHIEKIQKKLQIKGQQG